MASLYVNPQGYEVRSFSYSQGVTFHECAQKYKLQRLDGWNEIGTSAARFFGLALEAAIKTYHETDLDLDAGLVHFVNEWNDIKELHTFERWAEKNEFGPRQKATLKRLGIRGFRAGDHIKYTPSEGNWENLLQVGQEMLKLYHLRLPSSPIDLSLTPKFQIKYYKELFPGTELAGIEFVAYIDMMARKKNSLGDMQFWDIKTSGASLDLTPGILALDQQIRAYAWITGEPNGGMIYFQKVSRSLEKGSEAALLENVPIDDFSWHKAGSTVFVAAMDKGDEAAPRDLAWIVSSESELEKMDAAQGFKNGKLEQTNAAKERKLTWLKENAVRVPTNFLTKQKLHFVTAYISAADQEEAARQIGQDVAAITHANAENWWPKQGGVRFPNNRCCTCQMRGICLQNNELRDTLVWRNNEAWDNHADLD
jgi:PD-(D/E)XK nuclease superfamily